MRSRFQFLLLLLICILNPLKAQKTKYEITYSTGICKSEVLDERDNSIIYVNSGFQPFYLHLKVNYPKWVHQLSFYYINNTLTPLKESIYFRINSVASESGELNYDLVRRIWQSENIKWTLFAGSGIHAFGAYRQRKSLYFYYPYEDKVTSYDVNAGSLQIILNPVFKIKKHQFSVFAATGILSYLTRPYYYNPLFNWNGNSWYLISIKKHINFQYLFDYKFDISNRFSTGIEYRCLYYKYSFPYELKSLTQNYLIGLTFKF